SPSLQRIQLTLAARASPEEASEIQSLLHARLRMGGLLVAGFHVYIIIVWVLRMFRSHDFSRENLSDLSLDILVFAVFAGLTAFLWGKRQIPLRHLRVLELLCLGLLLTVLAWIQFRSLLVERLLAQRYALARTPEEGEDILFIYSSAFSLSPFILIIGY